jgi:long-chain fatty acid transport protein
MKHTISALRIATLMALGSACLPALATDGYFPHGFGLKAKGMGGAATALAQDGFAGANNPAASAFAGNRLELGADVFMPDREMSRSGTGGMLDVRVRSDKRAFLIPEVGYNTTISDALSWGVTAYGNGGMNTTYPGGQLNCGYGPANALCGQGKLGVDLMQLVVAPTVAVKLHEHHSIGVSPLLVFQMFKASGLEGFSQMSVDASKLSGSGYDTSQGVGVRLGYMGQLSDAVSLGVSYSPKINMSRFKDYAGLFANQGEFDIPANATVGLAVKATPSLTVAADYQRIDYGKVPAIGNAGNTGPLGGTPGGGFGWRNIDVFKLGVQWQMSPSVTLRAGYNHSDNPVTGANITPNILAPGVITSHYTLGATYAMSPTSELTWAFMYAPRVSVSGPSMLAGTETVSMRQTAIGLQWGMKF